MSEVQNIESLTSKLDINKEDSKEDSKTTPPAMSSPSSEDKAGTPEVAKKTVEEIGSQKKPQSPGGTTSYEDEFPGEDLNDLPPKLPRFSDMFNGPVSLVIRSPTNKSRSASGEMPQRSVSSASLDSAVLSDDSGTTEGGGNGGTEEERQIRDQDLRHRLTRWSIGCYNPPTEENMIPKPLPTHDAEGNPIEYTERRIPIGIAPAGHMVPLLDRPAEMIRLMEYNKEITNRIKYRLGFELWPTAKKLWTETPRSQMKDMEWLRQSYYILVTRQNNEKRFWLEWKRMVGYTAIDSETLFKDDHKERPASAGSSLQLDRIQEGDD